MKRKLLLLGTLLMLLSGCAGNKAGVDNPYEIAKGKSTVSYYDAGDSIELDGFEILERESENVIGLLSRDSSCIIVRDEQVRCIYIVDEDVVTYNQIAVGDGVDKLESTYDNIEPFQLSKTASSYITAFDDGVQVDPDSEDMEEDWIRIIYYVEDSRITAIQICDTRFAVTMQ